MITAVLIIIFLAGAVIVEILRETHSFQTVEYEIASDKLKDLQEEVRIVFLSDLHNKSYGRGNCLLLEAIDRMKPSMILIAGDMIVSRKNEDMGPALGFLRELSGRFPVYISNGNHEHRLKLHPETFGDMYLSYQEYLKACGIHLLENEKATIRIGEVPLIIYGLEIHQKYFKRFSGNKLSEKDITSDMGGSSRAAYNILLAHNPVYFKAYAKWGADLTLSGHLHGGIVRLPGVGGVLTPQAKLFPKYDAGMFFEDGHHLIVSRGLGTHTINIRLFNPAELILIRLRPE